MGRVARIDFPRDGIIDYLGSRQKERLFRENTITQLVIISKVGMYVAQRARSQKKKKKKRYFVTFVPVRLKTRFGCSQQRRGSSVACRNTHRMEKKKSSSKRQRTSHRT